MVRAGLWDVPPDFRCRKPEFAEYLDVSAAYDQQQRMGRMYWAVHNDDVVGYMMLAMGSVGDERQAELGIDTYGQIPALAIARLATDERHERCGVGRYMASYAIKFARRMAPSVGCRIVLANSAPDAVGFYKKMGFVKFARRPPSGSGDPRNGASKRSVARANEENGLVLMYLDMGLDMS